MTLVKMMSAIAVSFCLLYSPCYASDGEGLSDPTLSFPGLTQGPSNCVPSVENCSLNRLTGVMTCRVCVTCTFESEFGNSPRTTVVCEDVEIQHDTETITISNLYCFIYRSFFPIRVRAPVKPLDLKVYKRKRVCRAVKRKPSLYKTALSCQ